MRRKHESKWTEFSAEIDGKDHKGRYYVESDMVTVRLSLNPGSRELCTQIGGGTGLSVARMLLRELVSAKTPAV